MVYYVHYWCFRQNRWLVAGDEQGYDDFNVAVDTLTTLKGQAQMQTTWIVSDLYGNTVFQG